MVMYSLQFLSSFKGLQVMRLIQNILYSKHLFKLEKDKTDTCRNLREEMVEGTAVNWPKLIFSFLN